MECLICGEKIIHAHLGVNSCRACAVFYKRTTESKKKLKCKGGAEECRKINPKTTCRLCRFTRFNEILTKAVGDSESMEETETIEESMEVNRNEESDGFINHESFYDCEPSTSQTPLLDRLRKGYSLMCLIRHSGELGNRTKCEEHLELRVGNLVLVPATYSTVPIHGKICREAMKAFASHSFDDFRALDEESKNFIMKSAHGAMNALESAYRSAHNFPNNDDIRTPGYTTYVRTRELEQFFENCPDKIDSVKIVSEIRESLDRSVKGVRRYFKRVKPTDYEFLALLGLALWNDEIANLNEKLLHISMRNRAMIMKELHSYYAQQGNLNYAVRIGHLYCLLVYFQNNTMKICEDFQLYRLQGVFKEYFDKNCE
ncbi:hypothetical protein PENTCL1PPCAC_30676 [Pristionchus entomophagus]|uniref:Nuclear receptor n=1 Tax=Pristionchus entomophagus TaxID=358040 RepID=A0AAV5UQB5_9BILA|nr:hypothetical protein PENTCL1PPCAC_30676 [Pristionchus entomophagus]